ncbi:hypothetical protein JOC94_001880 [Bacillus thermophilus]|uniref:Peptidase M14 domain-containing protein n=1 Tax=Siminovitchia thermophila TaxID=1245522 RepID=A0ABS2R5N4_9BACI|nr:M28 family peptidase [Siminovitchia thermophila]MBM7714908.1 hypothetical protein [Siminovitchia thermophila]
MRAKRLLSFLLAVTSTLALTATSFVITPLEAISAEPVSEKEVELEQEMAHVQMIVPDQKTLEELVANGYDIAGINTRNDDIEVQLVVSQAEMELLKRQGLTVKVIQTSEEAKQQLRQQQKKMQRLQQQAEDKLNIFRSDYFKNQSGTFLYLEVKSSAGPDVAMTAEWTNSNGEKETAMMTRKVDSGEYLYHYVLKDIEAVPEKVTITTQLGGKIETTLKEWIGDGTPSEDEYFSDFVDHYMTPIEITERIEQLAKEFPELAEIVTLPNKTNGYRRKAQATIGSTVNSAFVLTSQAWGHEGGNDIEIDLKAPDKANEHISVSVEGNKITVRLGTDGSSKPNSTADQVIAAMNGAAGQLIKATRYRNSNGTGIVQPESGIKLSDFLNAPKEVSREPQEVKAIRIGKVRDGSKPGVLGYSQEHAREWVTPLVSVETAERLLRNYHTDENTKTLVDNLDIFIVPSVNPDGGLYSFYDYNMQRRNLVNYCGPEGSDSANRNSWGVDLNRNHKVGTVYEGWIGGSTNCLSDLYAGPEPSSEPESRNLTWLAEQNPNITFAMNIHSHGGYFMWSPGAYDANRKTLPRPTAGQEAYFWQASEHILKRIKEHRGTVILPGRTGPIPDVLYSAGGNSADTLWYEYGIYAWNFEVGAPLWDSDTKRWVSVGFQPDFEEGHAEAMEFASGLIGLLEVAYQNATDETNPESTLSVEEGTYHEPIEVTFKTSEPATVYYTLDGSRPTLDSNVIRVAGTREGAETLTIEETTTIKWFSVDAAGNIENGYDPDGEENQYNEAAIVIDYLPEGVTANGMKSLVERFEKDGEFAGEVAARALKTHLAAVDLYERQKDAAKVAKHMKSFHTLLEQQEKNELVSAKVVRILKPYSDKLIELWDPQFASDRAMKHLQHLSVDIGPRVTGTEQEKQAAQYIKTEFEKMGYEVSTQEFDIRGGQKSQNVIAVNKPKGISNPELVYVTAHYDSVSRSPGANDNGSGTSTMLELARAMKHLETTKEIRFVAFGAEEIGLVGSRYYVGQLPAGDIERSIANFNLDMVGTKYESASQLHVNTVDGNSNLVWESVKAASEQLEIDEGILNLYQFSRSDHVPFHEAGIDAALFIWMVPGTAGLEPWYHTPDDKIENISPERVQLVGNVIQSAVTELITQKQAIEKTKAS